MPAGTETTEDRLRGQLEALRNSYDQAVIAPRAVRRSETTELLVFEIGSAAFAVPVGRLVEAVRAEGMVAVPCSPPQIAGALTHRQEVVSVLDMRRLLGIPAATDAKPGWALVLRPNSSQQAILADSVVGIRRVNLARLPPVSAEDGDTRIIAESVMLDGRPVAIVNTECPAFGAVTTGKPGASMT